MSYEKITGYFVDISENDHKDLISTNDEYAEISSIIKDYETCLWLERKYFSIEKWYNENDPEFREAYYIYDPNLAKENKVFFEKWPKKREKLIAKLNEHKYLFKTAKNRDEDILKHGDIIFKELKSYYEKDDSFCKLKNDLEEKSVKSNNGDILYDYIVKLYARRKKMVKEYLSEKKESLEGELSL